MTPRVSDLRGSAVLAAMQPLAAERARGRPLAEPTTRLRVGPALKRPWAERLMERPQGEPAQGFRAAGSTTPAQPVVPEIREVRAQLSRVAAPTATALRKVAHQWAGIRAQPAARTRLLAPEAAGNSFGLTNSTARRTRRSIARRGSSIWAVKMADGAITNSSTTRMPSATWPWMEMAT